MSAKLRNAKKQITGALDAAGRSVDTHKDKLTPVGLAGAGIVANIASASGTVGMVGAVTASLPAIVAVGAVGGAGVAILAGYGVYKFWREGSADESRNA